MATVTVTADNNRIEDCEATTGFANIGGGAGVAAEAPFAYQGNLLINRKVTSATGAGFDYTPTSDGGTAIDMTATGRRTWMLKAVVSDYNGLDATDGVLARIGSGATAYYAFILAGTDSPAAAFASYRATGGLLVIPVDPNEHATYNDTAKDGSSAPTLTAIDLFGVVFAFSSSSAKNENCGLDAIDVGAGLYLVGGDGASPDGVYQDFVDHDEGTVGNRYGYARNGDGGVILAFGNWTIGANSGGAVNTAFTAVDGVLYWLDHLAAAGFNVVTVNLGNASTVVSDGTLHIGAGSTANVDSRPDYVVTGTAGSFTFTGTLRNFRNVTLTSACSLDGASVECKLLTQGTAHIENSTIRTVSLTSVACITSPTFGSTSGIHDVDFVQAGAGHAYEIASAGTYTLTNVTHTGYGANTSDSAAIDVTASSGTVTINVQGGDTPTFKTAGATVVISNTVTVKVTAKDAADSALIGNARVYLEAASGGPLPAAAVVTITRSGSTASVTHTAHGMVDGQQVTIRGAVQSEYNGIFAITNVTTNAYDYTVTGTPTTPATGTITCTAVVLNTATNASGIAQNTGFNFASNQPVVGKARRGTTAPTYKSGPVGGTITSAGLDTTAFLVGDD